jgi:hypothetical protein
MLPVSSKQMMIAWTKLYFLALVRTAIFIPIALSLSGCASFPVCQAPKYVTLDSASYIVCSGSIIVNKEGWGSEPTYDVSFTARHKLSDTSYYEDEVAVRGVRSFGNHRTWNCHRTL